MDPRHPRNDGAAGAATASKPRPLTPIAAPSPALPKGGGAIRGLGEKLSVNGATGTSSLRVRIPTSAARSGFAPELWLLYRSGSGNSSFGVGWQLSLDQIARKTNNGLPRYDGPLAHDVFVLTGLDDLVPALRPDGTLDQVLEGGEVIQRYRSRTEEAFARIELCWSKPDGVPYWRVISRDNVTSIYGRSEGARIADPTAPERVFAWLLEERRDDRSNVIQVEYKAEDLSNVARVPHERSRHKGDSPIANRYVKRIRYGNTIPGDASTALFEVVFDYGEHDEQKPTPDEVKPWPCREDAFSDRRAGFDVRAYRLCRRVLMFHHVAELGPGPCLVRSMELAFDHSPVLTRLVRVTESGHARDPISGEHTKKSLPALEFGYSLPRIHRIADEIDDKSARELVAAPKGTHQWNDLEGEGLLGMLLRRGDELTYKQNLGGGVFAPACTLPTRPSLAAKGLDVVDIDGDGKKEMVFFERPLAGYYRRSDDGTWEPYQPFGSQPVIDWSNPNLQFIDLTGDGRTDVLIPRGRTMLWYPSLGKDGYGPPIPLQTPLDEDRGVVAVFASHKQMLFLADMTGDGLLDLVRVRNSSVCYWPNLGHGRFGAKVEMTNAPWLDYIDQFDPRRVRLADIDGSGTTDLIYIDRDGIQLYINQSGNSLGPEIALPRFPDHSPHSTIEVFDLLGTGTACVVWSTPLPGFASSPVRFIDVLGGEKPYLLTSVKNNLGAETRLRYAPSTKFYLADRAAACPWVTRLPFVVHVVERVETADHVSDVLEASEYRYHHGHYDGAEREFSGFACVETIAGITGSELFPEVRPQNHEHQAPPERIVSWFFTGGWREDERIREQIEREVFAGDPEAARVAALVLPDGLSTEEQRQAHWATRGKLRCEATYWIDGSADEAHPAAVVEHGLQVRHVQPAPGSRPGVFLVAPRESVMLRYERARDEAGRPDPRVEHDVVLQIDAYGTVLESVSLAYPRRRASTDPAFAAQGRLWAKLTENDVFHLDGGRDGYRLGIPVETRTWEIHGLTASAAGLSFEDVAAAVAEASAQPIAHEDVPPAGRSKRLLGRTRIRYRDSVDPTRPLPFGSADVLALPYERYALALTPGQIAQTFNATVERVTPSVLSEGGYVQMEDTDGWWIPSGREVLDPARFYLTTSVIDPFAGETAIEWDRYALLVRGTRDALGNETRAENDYRVLSPSLVTDVNGNQSAVRFDELGRVVASAVMGKEGEHDGDTLESPTEVVDVDLTRFARTGKATFVHTRTRERHADTETRWQESYVYFDGSGHEILRKVKAEPGPAPALDAEGRALRGADERVVMADTDTRWVATGRTVHNNKGDVIKKYENYFSATHEIEDDAELRQWGVTDIAHYDAMHRVVRIDHPDGTVTRAEHAPWHETRWDPNDTVLDPGNAWFAARQRDAGAAPAEQRAAALAAEHASTPSVIALDPLGRAFLAISDLGGGKRLTERTELDIEGNALRTIDARGNVAEANTFDVAGRLLYRSSHDAGERWMLTTVLGNPLRTWDGRGTRSRAVYDVLRRPIELWLQDRGEPEIMVERNVFGEGQASAAAQNLRGKLYQQFDGAGVVTHEAYDCKGNLVRNLRRLAEEYRTQPDWSGDPTLDAEIFAADTTFDALNRPVLLALPDGSQVRPAYNARGLLSSVHVRIRGEASRTLFISTIEYNAKGQRERIVYGNGVVTECAYDPFTFRLNRIKTTRGADGVVLQDLRFVHDPVGNIVENEDKAQKALFYGGEEVKALSRFVYDAINRLIEAHGREHAGQNADVQQDQNGFPLLNVPSPNDPQAMRNYAETYELDDAGNLLVMRHQAGRGSWTRRAEIAAGGNRLLSTSLPGDPEGGPYSATYAHDEHGNITSMLHLRSMVWNAKNQLRAVDLGGGGMVYYSYNAAGERVRKLREHNGIVEEQLYLGGCEIYRRREGRDRRLVLERSTLHVSDGAQRIALVETKTVDTAVPAFAPRSRTRYQLGNHLGSAMLELDEAGMVISYEEYHPYGTTAFHATRARVEVSLKRYRYTGKERDEESGFYYHGARYYAPWLGRWTSPDPMGLVDGTNLYAYVGCNPVSRVDPTGFQGEPHEIHVRSRPPGIPSNVDRWAYASGGGLVLTSSAKDFAQSTQGLSVFVLDKDAPEGNTALALKAAEIHKAQSMAAALTDALKQSGGGGSPSAWAEAAAGGTQAPGPQGNRATQSLALAAGIANQMLDEDIRPREGASPHGIVGGQNYGARSSPAIQATASTIMLGAGLIAEAFVNALRRARALSKMLLLAPKATSAVPAEVVASKGAAANAAGLAREQRVAELVRGEVSREPIKTRFGSSDIDVIGPNGELIAVGGPAKAANLSKLGTQLKILQEAAASRGVVAKAAFEEGTPQAAIDLAIKKLGVDNVIIFAR